MSTPISTLKKKSSRPFKVRPEQPDFSAVILGIDPGTLVTGYGVLSIADGKIELHVCGAIRNRRQTALPERLKLIDEELSRIIGAYLPQGLAIESAFYGKNAQSALKLGHARGVSILAAARAGIPVCEYSPREIKKAVTGNGNATKVQVQYMVRSILRFEKKQMMLDTSDAIATAICHLHRLNGRTNAPKDWKSFVGIHPERVVQ
jgi:crossover junction endodeoxyribonuclease RuvC